MTARDQLQNQAKRCERIAAYLYDRARAVGNATAEPEDREPWTEEVAGSLETYIALTAHTAADACQESADTLRGIAQVYAGRIP